MRFYIFKTDYLELSKGHFFLGFEIKKTNDDEAKYPDFKKFYKEIIIKKSENQDLTNFDDREENPKGIFVIDESYLEKGTLLPFKREEIMILNEDNRKSLVKVTITDEGIKVNPFLYKKADTEEMKEFFENMIAESK